ncbi:GGDEF domain-containing protein [Exiguobacterium qingdaonense]|uniref:GGDEF domain-containing protein n=1 Tax=Exiguobacterium qingdaonense TaxID=2751251 RepID=UPI001BE8D52D|nr:GGDEF domain-containing protein [Exiguobacterium qingdaonense]
MGTTYESRRGTLYNERITFYGNVIAWLVHFLLCLIFWRLDVTSLFLSNALSVTYYTVSFYFVHKRWYGIFFAGLFIEVIYNAIISTIILGWGINMHYFILMMAYGVFFIPSVTRGQRTLATVLALLIYSLLFINVSDGIETLPEQVEQALGLFCILSTVMMIVGLSFIFESAVVKVTDELELSNERLQILASTDGLTGLLNRKVGHERISEAIDQAARDGVPYALALGDIDRFKSFNETYGHDCGDRVIQQVATTLSDVDGIAVRWGGEEFLLFLSDPACDFYGTTERLRRQVEETHLDYAGERLHVTMTFGLAIRTDHDTIEEIVKEADDYLREGKQNGKNQVRST